MRPIPAFTKLLEDCRKNYTALSLEESCLTFKQLQTAALFLLNNIIKTTVIASMYHVLP